MARFEVWTLRGGALVLDCQADIPSDLGTRFVVPLLPVEEGLKPAHRLNLQFGIGGRVYMMATQFAAAIERRELDERVGSLEAEATAISSALDMLLTGY
jgi:toxin CcdB